MDNDNGYKLYNEDHSIWSWHATMFEASARVAMEQRLYGRTFQIAQVTDNEWVAGIRQLANQD